MKLGASVYVPTPQSLVTIINRSCRCGPTGRGLPRIMGQTKLEIITFSKKDIQREKGGYVEWPRVAGGSHRTPSRRSQFARIDVGVVRS